MTIWFRNIISQTLGSPFPRNRLYSQRNIINYIIKVDNIITNIEDTPISQATQLDFNVIDEYKDLFYKITALVLLIILLVCMLEHLDLQENILNVWLKNITNNIIFFGQLRMVFPQNVQVHFVKNMILLIMHLMFIMHLKKYRSQKRNHKALVYIAVIY